MFKIMKLFKIFTHVILIIQKQSLNYLDIVNNVIFDLKFPNPCISFQTYFVCKHHFIVYFYHPPKKPIVRCLLHDQNCLWKNTEKRTYVQNFLICIWEFLKENSSN